MEEKKEEECSSWRDVWEQESHLLPDGYYLVSPHPLGRRIKGLHDVSSSQGLCLLLCYLTALLLSFSLLFFTHVVRFLSLRAETFVFPTQSIPCDSGLAR